MQYTPAINHFVGLDITSFQTYVFANQTIQAMLSHGCSALVDAPRDFFVGALYCDGDADLFRPLTSLCPQSCGCVAASPLKTGCPASCAANASA